MLNGVNQSANRAPEVGIPSPHRATGRYRTSGYTLLELVVVISVIAIFMGVAIPIYSRSILRARESALQKDLDMLNGSIVRYTLDKQKAPQGLDDLRAAGYIEKIPDDPMTGEENWEVEQDETLMSIDQQDPGIIGVHSASNAIGSNGETYSSWGVQQDNGGK